MKTPRQEMEARVAEAVARLFSPAPPAPYVRPCPDARHGDFQSNVALVQGKTAKANPREVAEKLAAEIDLADVAEKPEIAGPGFLNFRLKPSYLAAQLTARAKDARLGVTEVAKPQTIVIDYSGPNIAKEMHVGHLRSTILGDALARIYCFLGHEVIADNHIGDWGTGFGMILFGYKREGDAEKLKHDPFGHLEGIYRKVQEESKAEIEKQKQQILSETIELAQKNSDVSLDEEAIAKIKKAAEAELTLRAKKGELGGDTDKAAKRELVLLQQGDATNLQLWKQFLEYSMKELEVIYQRLGVQFDHTLGESFYNDMLPGVVADLLKSGLARESEGAVAIFSDGKLEPKNDPFFVSRDGELVENPLLIRKSDGGFNYASTDLATIRYRHEQFHAERVIYVVDGRQQMHFRQLFNAAQRWGYGDMKLEHVWFGTILGPDKKPFKSREGENVKLKALVAEAEERAAKIVLEKRPELSEHDRLALARIVGLGALKYADLAQNRNLDYVFSWEKLLAFDGNTAPYLQNAYVRIRAIFRKAGLAQPPKAAVELKEPAELLLGAKLLDFADSVFIAAEEYRPHYLCLYLFELATTFHKFYESCPVLTAEPAVRDSRLVLCDVTARTLALGLNLLGIDVVEQM